MWLLPGGINDATGQHWTWQPVEDPRESLADRAQLGEHPSQREAAQAAISSLSALLGTGFAGNGQAPAAAGAHRCRAAPAAYDGRCAGDLLGSSPAQRMDDP